jgi:hypothetical protein
MRISVRRAVKVLSQSDVHSQLDVVWRQLRRTKKRSRRDKISVSPK